MVSPGQTLRYEKNHSEHATVYFSIEHARPRDAYVKTSNAITSSCFAGNIRDLNIQRQDGNENVNKTIGLISKTTTLHVHHAFLPFSQDYDYDMKIPNFAFYGERKQATAKFHFFFLNLDMVPRSSTHVVRVHE